MLARVVLLLVAGAASVALAEAATRIAFRHVTSAASARGFFSRGSPGFLPNRFGFREREFKGEVPPERYRLIVIGDSITFGQGLDTHDRFGDLLQRHLGANDYEVLNFGLGGNDLRSHDELLGQRVLPLAPDFVLLQLYVNDFEPSEARRPEPLPLLPLRAADEWLFRSSALYMVATIQWQSIQQSLGWSISYPEYMASLLRDPESGASRTSSTLLRQFIERAQRAGVPVGIVFFPNLSLGQPDSYPFAYLHDRVAAICRDYAVDCLDLREAYSRYRPSSRLWVNRFDPHPNALANRVAAAALLGRFGGVWGARQKRAAPLPAGHQLPGR